MTTTMTQPTLGDLFDNEEVVWEDEILSLYLLPATDHVDVRPALRDSIAEIGVQVPILVAQQGTQLTIIDGLHRVQAAREADAREIPARIAHVPGTGAAALTLIANTQRRSNEVAEFDAIQRLMTEGHDESAVARLTGIPVGTIRKRLTLASLTPELMQRVRKGEMTAPAGEAAAKLPKARQHDLADVTRDNPKVRYRDVRDVQQVVAAKAASALPESLFGAATALPAEQPAATAPNADEPTVDTLIAKISELRANTAATVEDYRAGLALIETMARKLAS